METPLRGEGLRVEIALQVRAKDKRPGPFIRAFKGTRVSALSFSGVIGEDRASARYFLDRLAELLSSLLKELAVALGLGIPLIVVNEA